MRIISAMLLLLLVFSLTGCFSFFGSVDLTTEEDAGGSTDIVITVIPDTSAADSLLTTEAESTDAEETEASSDAEPSSTPEISSADEITSKPQEGITEPEKTTSVQTMTEVELSISMPEKNGTMVVETSSSNKFIGIVADKKNIDTDLLIAVFAVPESGQNYVFEFYDENGRGVDDIRRVYLIDEKGKISGIAAVKSSERENISSIENWFCMNVLIKELVYPAISEDLK